MFSSRRGVVKYLRVFLVLVSLFSVILLIRNKLTLTCANSVSCLTDLSGDFEIANKGVFHGREVELPATIASEAPVSVLGEGTSDNKRITIDLTTQKLTAYEGDRVVFEFPVSTGKWYPTPVGDFRIWVKLRYTRMAGGNPAIHTYYNLPNVPFTMYFYNDKISKARGFGLHGAYWHNNFGHPMSHGCVNMKIPDAKTLFEWAGPTVTNPKAWSINATSDNPGTKVVIYGEAPKE